MIAMGTFASLAVNLQGVSTVARTFVAAEKICAIVAAKPFSGAFINI